MKRLIVLCLLMISVACSALAVSPVAGSTPTDVVLISNDTRIKVRKAPDSDSKQLGWADPGFDFPYLGSVSTWYCIDYEGEVGYISSRLGRVVPQENGARYVSITSPSGVNIRSDASSKAKQIGKADQNDAFLYMGEDNGWYRVLCDGEEGYVSAKLSTVSSGNTSSSSSSSSGIRLDDVFSASTNFRVNASSSVLAGSTPTDYVCIDNDTRINVRRGPGSDTGKLGWAEVGSKYPYLGTTESWYCIEYGGEIGYIAENLGRIEKNTSANAQYVAVTNPSACNVRMSASADSTQIGKADPGDKFLYKGTENGWYKVLFNGKTGYVSSKLTQLTDGQTQFSRRSSSSYSGDSNSGNKSSGGGKSKLKACSKCRGTGRCSRCAGTGAGFGNARQCYSCNGSGRCFFCGGLGHTPF